MDDRIKNMLEKYSDSRGRIDCIKALKIAAMLNMQPERVGKTATDYGFRIKNCEFAQFGSKRTGRFNGSVYEELKKYTDKRNRIKCVDAIKLAEKYGFYRVRSTIKNSDIDVIYCQLGCFKEKKRPRLKVKTKVWVENKEVGMVLGKGKLEILELIDETGSISAAANRLGVSYKKVWNHIQILEKNMDRRYVITSKGRGSGGSVITKEAKEVMSRFKKLQKEVEEYANDRFSQLFYEDRKFRDKRSQKR